MTAKKAATKKEKLDLGSDEKPVERRKSLKQAQDEHARIQDLIAERDALAKRVLELENVKCAVPPSTARLQEELAESEKRAELLLTKVQELKAFLAEALKIGSFNYTLAGELIRK